MTHHSCVAFTLEAEKQAIEIGTCSIFKNVTIFWKIPTRIYLWLHKSNFTKMWLIVKIAFLTSSPCDISLVPRQSWKVRSWFIPKISNQNLPLALTSWAVQIKDFLWGKTWCCLKRLKCVNCICPVETCVHALKVQIQLRFPVLKGFVKKSRKSSRVLKFSSQSNH